MWDKKFFLTWGWCLEALREEMESKRRCFLEQITAVSNPALTPLKTSEKLRKTGRVFLHRGHCHCELCAPEGKSPSNYSLRQHRLIESSWCTVKGAVVHPLSGNMSGVVTESATPTHWKMHSRLQVLSTSDGKVYGELPAVYTAFN